jgi:hypothetical protein
MDDECPFYIHNGWSFSWTFTTNHNKWNHSSPFTFHLPLFIFGQICILWCPFLCHNAKIPNLLTMYYLLSLIGEEICKNRFRSMIYIVIGISYWKWKTICYFLGFKGIFKLVLQNGSQSLNICIWTHRSWVIKSFV